MSVAIALRRPETPLRCTHCGGSLYRERVPFSPALEVRCIQCGREPGAPPRHPEPWEMQRGGHRKGDPIVPRWTPDETRILLTARAAGAFAVDLLPLLPRRTDKAIWAHLRKLRAQRGQS